MNKLELARRACDIVDALREYSYGQGFDSGFSFDLSYGDACALVEKAIEPAPALSPPEPTDEVAHLRERLEAIAGFGSVNLSGEYEHGLRDIIRSMTECAREALRSMPLQDHAQPENFARLRAENEKLREVLRTIQRTTFSGSQMSDEYVRGNRDAHTTCANMAGAALRAMVAEEGTK